ncbi:MAG: peroxiredoxin family protein [Thermoflexales bacterium]|nr:peroxiredoxin family protein [Thermoflexales bacterium]
MSSKRFALRVPRVGEPAPDFKATDVDGNVVRLSHQRKPVALVFLRHLA